MQSKTQRQYIIEYTFDKNHQEWFVWDGKRHISYAQAKDEMNKLAIREQEHNMDITEIHPKQHNIYGFRITEEHIQSSITTLTEILF